MGQRVRWYSGRERYRVSGGGITHTLPHFSTDGQTIASCGIIDWVRDVILWDTNLQLISNISVAPILPDGDRFASVSDGSWYVENCCFSDDGNLLALTLVKDYDFDSNWAVPALGQNLSRIQVWDVTNASEPVLKATGPAFPGANSGILFEPALSFAGAESIISWSDE